VIFNKKNDAWGHFSYNKSEDALRVTVDASYMKDGKENLAYRVQKNDIKFEWADRLFKMKVTK